MIVLTKFLNRLSAMMPLIAFALSAIAQNTAVFPGRVATNQDLLIASNNYASYLTSAITATATAIPVVSVTGLATPATVTINGEVIMICSISGFNLQVCSGGRGFDGTVAAAQNATSKVQRLIVAWDHNQPAAEIVALETWAAARGNGALADPGANGFVYRNGLNVSRPATSLDLAALLPTAVNPVAFLAQTPGGALNVGTNSFTLSPVPAGVNGSDAGHYLYISGGTGTPEACLINGGPAVAGAASGLIDVSCAHTHTGAWTVGSATAGVTEAFQTLGQYGAVVLPSGITQIYGPIYFTASYQSLAGAGRNTSLIQANFNSGNVIVDNGFSYVTMRDFGTFRVNGYSVLPTSGDTIGVYGAAYVQMIDLYLRHNFNGINTLGTINPTVTCVNQATLGNCSLIFATDIYLEAVANEGLIGWSGTLDGLYYAADATAGYSATYTPVDTVLIQFADGARLANMFVGGTYSRSVLYFNPTNCTNCRVDDITIPNMQLDSWIGGPAVIFGGVAGVGTDGITFTNCSWSNSLGNSNPAFRINAVVSALRIVDSSFALMQGKIFDAFGDSAGVGPLIFSNNQISAVANTLSAAITLSAGGLASQMNWAFIGNVFWQGSGSQPQYDLQFLTAPAGLTVTGNVFQAYSVGPLNFTSVPTYGTIAHNSYLDDVPLSVASASSIALTPGYDVYLITGSTGIGTITGTYNGEQVTLVTTSSVIFTAGATIGNSLTTTANVPTVGTVIGGKIYLK